MIRIDPLRCTGCRSCESICAFIHSGRVGQDIARIKVQNIATRGVSAPIVCQQCKERYCLTCPERALTTGPNGEILVSPSLCTSCRKCENNCPIGAIAIFDELTYVCDLCDGTPRCVQVCSENAIAFAAEETNTISLAAHRRATRGMSSSEKRRAYLLRLIDRPATKSEASDA